LVDLFWFSKTVLKRKQQQASAEMQTD